MSLSSHRLALPVLVLGSLVLAACSADEHAPLADAEAVPPAAGTSAPAEVQPPGPTTAMTPASPGKDRFDLVTDQDRSRLMWTATADGQEIRGEVTLIVGGLYLVSGDLDGATGSISGNLRYVETGRPMWDLYLSESFFEALQPEREMAHAGVDVIRLPPATDKQAARRGEASINLGLARGSQKFVVPIEVSRSGQAWRLQSLESSSLDLGTLGYAARLGSLAQALGLSEISRSLLISFELYLEPMSPHEAGRSQP